MNPDFERLIGRAVIDPSFRKQILNDPAGAVKSSGLNISAEELERVSRGAKELTKSRSADEVSKDFESARGGGGW